MIKKLRTKFIMINMALVSLVLITVFTILCFSNYQRLKKDSFRTMSQALNNFQKEDFMIKPEIGKNHTRENLNIIPVFTIETNSDDSIQYTWKNNVTVSDDLIEVIKDKVLNSDKDSGIIREASLRYMKISTDNGVKIAFADMSNEISSMKNIIFNSVFTMLGSLAAFFIISLFLSKWALKPVHQAWTKQKQFVADASHELKTPLTVILANTNILLSHKDDTISNQLKWIDNTHAEAERMKELVDNLLFLAKSDSDRTPFVIKKFNLSDIIWSCILPFESIAFENKVVINEEIESDIYISGDEGQLKQLIMILLDNACKYTEKNGSINISLTKESSHIHLTVNNTGVSIPSEDLEHIFERFYRSDKSRVREKGGYGLGLSIAESIVKNHHGKISAYSSVDSGTTFDVILHI